MNPTPIPRNLIEQGIGIPTEFGPPPGHEDTVGNLQILILEDSKALLQGKTPDAAKFVSWWEPSEDERRRIATGAKIRLTIIGATEINPISLDVGSNLEGILFSPDSNGKGT